MDLTGNRRDIEFNLRVGQHCSHVRHAVNDRRGICKQSRRVPDVGNDRALGCNLSIEFLGTGITDRSL